MNKKITASTKRIIICSLIIIICFSIKLITMKDSDFTTVSGTIFPVANSLGFAIGFAFIPCLITCLVIKTPESEKKEKMDKKSRKLKEQENLKKNGKQNYLYNKFNKILLISAIISLSMLIITVILFAIINPIQANKQIEKGKNEATTITVTGTNAFLLNSINKNYEIYLLNDNNKFYLFQIIGNNKISVYEVKHSGSNQEKQFKAKILEYFDVVKEETPPKNILIKNLVIASYVISFTILFFSIALWTCYFVLKIKKIKSYKNA